MRSDNTKPNAQADGKSTEEPMEEDVENDPEQEFESLNSQIDQLNSVLDVLEKKNDDIQAQLFELLKSNREARKQLNEENARPSAS
ncbi:UPF0184 protein AAEL002161 [Macrosteles quadrilineatus]|uniref:UPF0184 protein AAEL002161 n=1 Tax=Macrosteles quadrilineatus TaxID=74068 RepID=UPI0023E300E9|nr:UPF0184 protein AAEL002161 [Macrosteles quadrilineatus]